MRSDRPQPLRRGHEAGGGRSERQGVRRQQERAAGMGSLPFVPSPTPPLSAVTSPLRWRQADEHAREGGVRSECMGALGLYSLQRRVSAARL